MRVLAIESAQSTVSIAVVEDDRVLAEYSINGTKDHSQTLLPTLKSMAERMGLDLKTLDAVAISGGPGSFTGLRIGSATAKGLAYSLGIPMVHIPTTDLMAYGIYGADAVICPLMDARNHRVYTGIYRFRDEFEVIEPAEALEVSLLAEKLNALGREVIFTGDGMKVSREILDEKLTVKHSYAPAHLAYPRAAAIGTLAMEYIAAGKTVDAAVETPDYLKPSQAEREFEQRNGMSVEEAVEKAREEADKS